VPDKVNVSDRIERLEVFEERVSVRLEALSAYMRKYSRPTLDDLDVYGELHPVNGNELECDIELVVTAYDQNGSIMGIGTSFLRQSNVFGFEMFKIRVSDLSEHPTKIRIFPKKGG